MKIKILKKFLDLLFPRQCLNCGEFGANICDNCERKFLDQRRVQECYVCKRMIKGGKEENGKYLHNSCKDKANLNGIFVCLNYTKLAEKMITQLKYGLYTDLVKDISKYYLESFENMIAQGEFDKEKVLLVPVPLYKYKQRKRGFNQAELIAKEISEQSGVKYSNLLMRVRNTRTQVGLSKEQRERNLNEAFVIDREKYNQFNKSSIIILIDDIMTTGTTLEKCASVLHSNRIRNIYGLVFTRG